MLAFPSGRKPKSQRAKRVLKTFESKIVEDERQAIFLRSTTANDQVTHLLRDLYKLKKPHGKFFDRRNEKRPFEDDTSVEFLCVKNNASVFAFGSHTKKRPTSVVLGRLFDGHVFDMYEMACSNIKFMEDFKGEKPALGSRPCCIFVGEDFENNEELSLFRESLLDFFANKPVDKTNLSGLDSVIVVTAAEGKVHFRHYLIKFKKSGIRTPRVELEEAGPSFDIALTRTKLPAAELRKAATRAPKGPSKTAKKNEETNNMGDKMGRIHMEKQDLDSLELRKLKALKRSRNMPDEVEGGEGDADEAPQPATGGKKKKRRPLDD